MKNVLFIAYHFPPLAGGGTFRSLKFVKYLPELGWQPTVVSTNTKNYWAYDKDLLNDISDQVVVRRAPEIDPFYLQVILSKLGLHKLYRNIRNHCLLPDEKIGWIPFAYRSADQALQKGRFDLIFSTSPTPCAHLIALRIHKNYNLPWVADFRDHWTLNPEYPPYSAKRITKERNLERQVVNAATKIIVVTGGNRDEMIQSFGLPASKVQLIHNGYDSDDFSAPGPPLENKQLTLLYTGTFYGDRNPDTLLAALAELQAEEPGISSSLRIVCIGRSDYDISANARRYGIENHIEHQPFQSRSALNRMYHSADVLLLIIPQRQNHVITSKLFDYMGLGKPILALVPNGEARSILVKSGLGYISQPENIPAIKNQIRRLFQDWKSKTIQIKPNAKYIRQFHRRTLSQKLAAVFEEIT